MVSSIIQTSTWSHNCGMHVIADFLVEKLQQDDFREIFSGKAYDELLKTFQEVYQKSSLTWFDIRESCLVASRINSQIMWGIPLRVMLQKIIKNDITYKKNLEEQYLALLNLLIQKKYTESYDNYPILFSANIDYLMSIAVEAEGFRATEDTLEAQKLYEQFNKSGFNRYCEMIMAIKENEGLYHWLGISELTVICDYFEINPVINDGYEPSKIKKGPNLNFFNSEGLHWERKITEDNKPNLIFKAHDNIFYQNFIYKGNDYFIKNIVKIGQIFFSDEYHFLGLPQANPEPTFFDDKNTNDASIQFQNMISDFKKVCTQKEATNFDMLVKKYKSSISLVDDENQNIFHHICLDINNRNVQFLIKELIQLKINVNLKNNQGYTPLHCAAFKNNIFAIVELVRQGCIIDSVTLKGFSACHIAALYEKKNAFITLKSLGASLSLEAYPNAISHLPFTWDLEIPLTPIKIAEYKQGEIDAYLIKNNLTERSKEDSLPLNSNNVVIVDEAVKKENKFKLTFVIKKLFDFYMSHKSNRELCLKVQNDFLLNVDIELSILDDDAFKILNLIYEESFPEWINRWVMFFESRENSAESVKNKENIIGLLVKHAFQSIQSGKENKLIDCFIADYRCLFLNGKNSVLHYALKEEKYDFVYNTIYQFFKSNSKSEKNPVKIKETLDQALDSASKNIIDEYDRTLEFRLSRKKQYLSLKEKLKNAKTIAEQIKYQTKLAQHYTGDANIYLVDKHHEKNKHSAKIRATKISKWGYPAMLAFRSASEIANGGVIRFGLEMARPYLPNIVQLPFTYVGGKIGSYAGDKMGYDSAYAEELSKMAIGNLISFALMPQYYVVSTILGGAVYYACKDSGYDNLEALCLLVSDGVSLGVTNNHSDNKQVKKDEAYQYQLNKNLTPIVGEYAAEYIAPMVTFADRATQTFDKGLTDNAAIFGEQLGQYYSQSTISSMVNTMGDAFSTPVEALQYLQQYNNSWIEAGFNYVEGNALHYLMNDSKFKNERLHVIQMYYSNQSQQSLTKLITQKKHEDDVLTKLRSSLDQAEIILTELNSNLNTPAKDIRRQQSVVFNLKELFNRQALFVKNLNSSISTQTAAVNQAIDLTQELYEKTEGFTFQEKWKDAYFAYKYSLYKPNKSKAESDKLLKEAEKALVECQFYNTETVNKMLDPWAKSVDDLFDRHKENFPDWNNPHHVINSIIDNGFKDYSDRNKLAKFLADEIIRLKYPLYPETGDKQEIEAERELLIREICTDELSGYQRKTNRSKNRLYDYFIAKVTNTEKKRHQHRWEKALKPFANEILHELVGWKPFKDFNGGDDGEPGRVGVQFNFNSDGSRNAQITVKDRPVATLYESEKPTLRLTEPERQAIMPPSVTQQEGTSTQNQAVLTYDTVEEETETYSSLNVDNPYIEGYMAEQHAKLFENINGLGKEQEDQTTIEKTSKQQTAKPESTPVSVMFSRNGREASGQTSWSQTHDRLIGNPQSGLNLGGPRAPIQISPDYLSSLAPQIKEGRIPVGRLPGLVWTALGEAGQDFVQGIISLNEFTYREIGHLKKGEDLESVQIAMLLGKFIGAEAARFALNEDLESAKIARKMILDFRTLPQEERLKAMIKFYAALITPGTVLKGTQTAGKLTGQIANKVIKKAKKAGVPEPVQFGRVSKVVEEVPRAPEPVQFAQVSGVTKVATGTPNRAPLSTPQINAKLADNHFEAPKIEPLSLNKVNSYTPQASSSKGQANIAQAQHLKRDLECRTCQTMFDHHGGLSYGAIQESDIIKRATELHNKEVILALSQRGNLEDWGKYRTQLFSTPQPSNNIGKSTRNIQAEVHFYRNSVTNEVYYGKDYKVKFQLPGNPQMPVEKFISELPHSWRAKP